jgi:hypothetical protein
VNLGSFDRIWHIRGSLPLAPGQSGDDAFQKLDPLFRQTGTTHHRTADTLTFQKKDPASQDKMSIFDSGVLQIEAAGSGPVLTYHLVSRALLYCFLAPLLFLGIAQGTIALNTLDKPAAEAVGKDGKVVKKPEVKKPDVPMNPIDKALGAPEPEKHDKKKADKKAAGKKGADKKDDEDGPNKKPSPTPAYVFAGIFAALYIGGRVLEDWLVKRLFRKQLHDIQPGDSTAPNGRLS